MTDTALHARPVAPIMQDARNSFQRALCPLLVAGQCFGLMPVSGLTGHDASNLQFRWLSTGVAYTFLSLIGNLCHFCFCIRDLVTSHNITYSACGKWRTGRVWICFAALLVTLGYLFTITFSHIYRQGVVLQFSVQCAELNLNPFNSVGYETAYTQSNTWIPFCLSHLKRKLTK